MALEVGSRIGSYEVGAKIGQGGMGNDVSLRSMHRSQSFGNSTLALLKMSEAEGRSQEDAGAARAVPCRIT